MSTLPPDEGIACPWYDSKEMAKLFSVNEFTIFKWTKSGQLPQPTRRGRRWRRWWKATVDAMLLEWAKEATQQEGGAA